MKLATLKNGEPDGQLIVVSRDLRKAVLVKNIASTLQDAIANWSVCFRELKSYYDDLNAGVLVDCFDLDHSNLCSPLPRAYQWLDSSAFHSHGNLMEKIFNIDPPPNKQTIPLMYQGGSDNFIGPYDDIPLPSENDGIDFEAEVAIITNEVDLGTSATDAMDHIKLVFLCNDTSLRTIIREELKTGFGFVQAKPSSSFSPIAVTPDELGDNWKGGRLHLPVQISWNNNHFGHPNAGHMGFGFHELVAHAARTRKLSAGTIIGSGTISNENFREVGSACIAEKRGIELEDNGSSSTEYMKFGDRVKIEMFGSDELSIFGAIDQKIVKAG